MKINILGSDYEVKINVNPNEDDSLNDEVGGYCDILKRQIVVVDFKMLENSKIEPQSSIDELVKRTLRHEIIHAYLTESGLWANSNATDSWAINEEMVDWIAMQFPKILETFKKVGCI